MLEAWREIRDAATRSVERLPPLLRFLGVHLIAGAAAGVVFVSLIVLFNVGGLKSLLREVDNPVLPLAALYVLHMLTFASVTMGAAVMLQRGDR